MFSRQNKIKIQLKKLACAAFKFTNNITAMNCCMATSIWFASISLKCFKDLMSVIDENPCNPCYFFSKWLVTAVLLWWWGTEDGWLSSTTEHAETFSPGSDRQVGCSSVSFRKFVMRMDAVIQKYPKKWTLSNATHTVQTQPIFNSSHQKVLYNL